MSSLVEKSIPSPVGNLRLIANEQALVALLFPDHRRAPHFETQVKRAHPVLDQAEAELNEYFRAERKRFTTPLAPQGTPFQRAVWEALKTIPFGDTRSYRALAIQVNKPAAVRAVGSANGRNPLSIFVPCHRVLGSTGALTGYAGGTASKQWLLNHERE
ncbi:MAG: methylated-DNA--[protein]-cysteine S-methyltransferase [Myxococcaceae bacterium]